MWLLFANIYTEVGPLQRAGGAAERPLRPLRHDDAPLRKLPRVLRPGLRLELVAAGARGSPASALAKLAKLTPGSIPAKKRS